MSLEPECMSWVTFHERGCTQRHGDLRALLIFCLRNYCDAGDMCDTRQGFSAKAISIARNRDTVGKVFRHPSRPTINTLKEALETHVAIVRRSSNLVSFIDVFVVPSNFLGPLPENTRVKVPSTMAI